MIGDAWALPEIGVAELTVHPVHLLDEDDWALLELWRAWRGGGLGAGHLPFAGGVADQSSCAMRSLAVMDDASAALEKSKKCD